jgi:signal recognition particle subunit SRP54
MEIFYPDRMTSRILGMGDVVSLVEKAAEDIDEKEARRLEERLRKNQFDFTDFRDQLRQMSKLGGTEGILKMLPGGKQLAKTAGDIDPKQLIHMEAIISSMTIAERENPDLISMSRRRRIAKGCGRPIEAVSGLIKQFKMMQKMMRKGGILKRLLGGGSVADMQSGGFPDGGGYMDIDRKAIAQRRKAEKLKKKQKQKQRRKKRK